jgi:hypothetical protein
MALSIEHNGVVLNTVELGYIKSTIVNNFNNKLSKAKSLEAINNKLIELKKERVKLFSKGMLDAGSLSDPTIDDEEKLCKYLASEILDYNFWFGFFEAVVETKYEDNEDAVAHYLRNNIRMTFDEYNYAFPIGFSADNSFAQRLNILVENNFVIPS